MSASLKPMRTDLAPATSTARIECTVDSDPRLIVAIGTIAAHAAQHIGLAAPAQENLAVAALEVCREAFPAAPRKGSSRSTIKMVVANFPDRVELTIETPGKARAPRKSAKTNRKPAATALVDRVEHETRGGHMYTTLVKYCAGATSRKKS